MVELATVQRALGKLRVGHISSKTRNGQFVERLSCCAVDGLVVGALDGILGQTGRAVEMSRDSGGWSLVLGRGDLHGRLSNSGHLGQLLPLVKGPHAIVSPQLRAWHPSVAFCTSSASRLAFLGSFVAPLPQVWAATGYDFLGCHRGHRNAVTCLALDSNFLFSGSDDCTICLWDTVPAVAKSPHLAGQVPGGTSRVVLRPRPTSLSLSCCTPANPTLRRRCHSGVVCQSAIDIRLSCPSGCFTHVQELRLLCLSCTTWTLPLPLLTLGFLIACLAASCKMYVVSCLAVLIDVGTPYHF